MQEIKIKMKHLIAVFNKLQLKSALELMDFYISCFKENKVLFKDLDWAMQQSLLKVKKYEENDEIIIPDYDQNKCYKFVEAFLFALGYTDEQIEEKIIDISEMYKTASIIFKQINELQTIVKEPADPNDKAII